MNLEALVSKLDSSKNREFANLYFEQMAILEEAREKYITFKEQYKVSCDVEVAKLITKRETCIAQNIGINKDYKELVRDLKLQSKAEIKVLKEDYKIESKQIKSELAKVEERLEKYYIHQKRQYEKSRNLDPDAENKFEAFQKEYNLFKATQLNETKVKSAQKLIDLERNLNIKIDTINNELVRKIKAATEAHQKDIDSKLVERNKVTIKEINEEIKQIKKDTQLDIKKNKEKVKEEKQKYLAIKKEVLAKIKQIEESKKEYASKLTGDEALEFKNLEKLILQEKRCHQEEIVQKEFKKKTRKINPAYFFIAPAFLGAIVMTIFPFIFMIISAWFKLDLVNLGNSQFVGFRNFVLIFTKDTEFQQSLVNTAIYAFVTFGLLTVVTVLMAAWLSKNTKIHNLAQTMVFTPHIASLVAVSIVWIALLNPTGIINQILAVFGIEGPGWLIQENTSLIAVSFVQVWKDIGYYVLIIISGLQGIPTYVYEAAKLDKANKATTFFKVTIPLLAPTLSFVFITKFINSFKVFAPIEIMTNGGPMGSSMVLSYWIYKVGRVGYNYGMAMAGAIILTIIVGTFTIFNHKIFIKK